MEPPKNAPNKPHWKPDQDLSNDKKYAQWIVQRLAAAAPMREGRCPQCWLLEGCCTCANPPAEVPVPPIRIAIYMHVKEYYRSTNTAVVLSQMGLATIYIAGREADDAALRADIAASQGRCALLFPKDGVSTSAQELMVPWLDQASNSAPAAAPPVAAPLLVVLDGTWTTARALVRRAQRLAPAGETLPLVHLSPKADASGEAVRSISMMRLQVGEGRVTTCEAVVELLREIGTDSACTTAIMDTLQQRITAVLERAGGAKRIAAKKRAVEGKIKHLVKEPTRLPGGGLGGTAEKDSRPVEQEQVGGEEAAQGKPEHAKRQRV